MQAPQPCRPHQLCRLLNSSTSQTSGTKHQTLRPPTSNPEALCCAAVRAQIKYDIGAQRTAAQHSGTQLAHRHAQHIYAGLTPTWLSGGRFVPDSADMGMQTCVCGHVYRHACVECFVSNGATNTVLHGFDGTRMYMLGHVSGWLDIYIRGFSRYVCTFVCRHVCRRVRAWACV